MNTIITVTKQDKPNRFPLIDVNVKNDKTNASASLSIEAAPRDLTDCAWSTHREQQMQRIADRCKVGGITLSSAELKSIASQIDKLCDPK